MASKKKLELEKHEPVQAVVMADSFDNKFGPLTDELPKVKLSFVAILTFLTIYICCSASFPWQIGLFWLTAWNFLKTLELRKSSFTAPPSLAK